MNSVGNIKTVNLILKLNVTILQSISLCYHLRSFVEMYIEIVFLGRSRYDSFNNNKTEQKYIGKNAILFGVNPSTDCHWHYVVTHDYLGYFLGMETAFLLEL
jgi:hypothetical protein